jgi:hypothetical protein
MTSPLGGRISQRATGRRESLPRPPSVLDPDPDLRSPVSRSELGKVLDPEPPHDDVRESRGGLADRLTAIKGLDGDVR